MKRALVLGYDLAALPDDVWTSSTCEVLIMQHWARERAAEAAFISEHLPDLPHHVWVTSSGTLAQAGQSKWIALSKAAIMASAEAVNAHHSIQKHERWGLLLPLAHVGGLGIVARSRLLGQKISAPCPERWDPRRFLNWKGELLSLVPTQVHDLVAAGIRPPQELRLVVVGGDRLAAPLLKAGRELGWPLLPSYGLTECASTVATALPGDEGVATFLPHMRARTDADGRLSLSGPSLFTGIARVENERIEYQERDGEFFQTEDLAEIDGNKLRIIGRRDAVLKVRGEKVDVAALEAQLQALHHDLVVLPLADARDGAQLWVVSTRELDLASINSALLPHQRLRGVKCLPSLPRNSLGKVKRGELVEWLQQQL